MSETVAVLGPGAVGGMVAVRLAAAGTRVVAVTTSPTAVAIRDEGLTLVTPAGELTERVAAIERLDEPVALLLVAVKSTVLLAALDRIAAPPELVVPLLNGLEHLVPLRARFGAAVSAGSIGHFEAYRDGPTRIVQTTAGTVITTSSNRAAELVRTDGIETRVLADERQVLWGKAARLAPVTAASALSQRTLGELLADPDWRGTLERAVEEACAVATADGAPTTTAEQWAMIAEMPSSLLTSAARDVAAGRPSELDAIVGGVVRAGRRLGVPTPVLAGLLEPLVAA
jgi:2-dehydropantoate 2-reductase